MSDDKKLIDIGKELKKQERRQRWEARKKKALDWWEDNKQTLIVVVPIAGAVLTKAVSVIGKNMNLRLEERNKDRRLYDTSLGHYWELRRKLNNRDWVQINRRRNLGESLGDILEEMRVLK